MRLCRPQEMNFILVITLHAMLHKYTHTKKNIYVYPTKKHEIIKNGNIVYDSRKKQSKRKLPSTFTVRASTNSKLEST